MNNYAIPKDIWVDMDERQSIVLSKYTKEGESVQEFIERIAIGKPKLAEIFANKEAIWGGRNLYAIGREGNITGSNCYVAKNPEDSLKDIFRANYEIAQTFAYGGGQGLNLSNLRPRGMVVNNASRSTKGIMDWADMYSETTLRIQQDGRRGALMLVLNIDHPDVIDFCTAKLDIDAINGANISLAMTDEFMYAVEADKDWKMSFETSHERVTKVVKARDLMSVIAYANHTIGDVGMLFIDNVNDYHLLSEYDGVQFTATNPCLAGDTLIQTAEGAIPIRDLVGQQPFVYSMDEQGKLVMARAMKVWKTRENANLVRVITGKGDITCTPEHKIYTTTRGWVEAQNLQKGDKVKGLNRKMMSEHYCGVQLSGEGKYYKEHRFIAGSVRDLGDKDVHHINGDALDNRWSNLEIVPHGEHSIITNHGRRRPDMVRNDKGQFMYSTQEATRKQQSRTLNKKVGTNWYVQEVIKLEHTEDVYDMTVYGTHNFVANDIVVHNCGEQPLLPNGSCNLGSVNLHEFVLEPFTENACFDYVRFQTVVREMIEGLDDLLDLLGDRHPLEGQREHVKEWRSIGLGVMGLADLALGMGVAYGSPEFVHLLDLIMHCMINSAVEKSAMLAKERGAFPRCDKGKILDSKFAKTVLHPNVVELVAKYGLRNSRLLSIAPTGSISNIFGVSGGVEPFFMLSYNREIVTQNKTVTVWEKTPLALAKHLGIERVCDLPDWAKVTSQNISFKDRARVQAVIQKYVDTAISSTFNIPNETTVEDISDVYLTAWRYGLKGMTVFRDNCKKVGILTGTESDHFDANPATPPRIDVQETWLNKNTGEVKELISTTVVQNTGADETKINREVCPICGAHLVKRGGCTKCSNLDCYYEKCAI